MDFNDEQIKTENLKGLSDPQIKKRREEYGFNELPQKESKTAFTIAWHILTEPMILLLLACGTIYFFLGDIEEASILIGCIGLIICITFYQENKTEKALEALRDLSSPRALVIRGGGIKRIPGKEVVVDDLVILEEGDRVPTDGIIIDSSNLEIDESLLTGESEPVRKIRGEGEDNMPLPGGKNSYGVFSGTLVVNGHGIVKVKRIGKSTEIGKIGRVLNEMKPELSRLQKEIKGIVFKFAVFGVLLCVFVAVIYSLTRNDWLNGTLSGLALAMGILPEEFPLILTIFLAFGSWRISKNRVLTRNLPAIENLGSINVLCVDKTGTITHNKMEIKALYAENSAIYVNKINKIPPVFDNLVRCSHFAVRKDSIEPMEMATRNFCDKFGGNNELPDFDLIKEYPLSRKLLAISHVWRSKDGKGLQIISKGAPEAIISLCHLGHEDSKRILEQVEVFAGQGLRVIGVAKSESDNSELPEDHHNFEFEFIGLIAMADTIRSTVKDSVQECYDAGVRVIMITGDYAGTAKNIAQAIGLKDPDLFITGDRLNKMSDDELKEAIRNVNIFARVIPEQKLRIIKALKANHLVVAMTGDGVNDAPALKSADIGIAMGGKGTDVAREASDMVLLDDDFSSIVKAIKMGRTVYANLKKAVSYIIAVHIPIAGISFLPVVLNWPLILLPVQIVFMELVVDPACSLVFEKAPSEKNVMKTPPRKLKEPLFNKKNIMFSIFQGLIVFATMSLVLVFSNIINKGAEETRALTFSLLVIANMILIFVNYSWGSRKETFKQYNLTFWFIQALTFALLITVLYVPYMQNIFKFSYLHLNDWGALIFLGALSFYFLNKIKYYKYFEKF